MFGWALLHAELGRWARAGRRPQLWWRDDGARGLSPALERLIACADAAGVPLSLAVIPDGAEVALAIYVNERPSISVMQYGVDHRNDCPSGPPAQFNVHAAPATVACRLNWGWARLAVFDRRLPVYVPPWNDLKPNTQGALAAMGRTAVSAFGAPAEPERLDTHLDLLGWAPRPRFAGRARILGRLRRMLKARRENGLWAEPVGLLTHHLDHDEDAWIFLGALLADAALSRTADWRSAQDLLRLTPAWAKTSASSQAPAVPAV